MRGRRALVAALAPILTAACGGEVLGTSAVRDDPREDAAAPPRGEGGLPPGTGQGEEGGVPPGTGQGEDASAPGACPADRRLVGEIIVGDDSYRWGGVPAALGGGVTIADLEGVTVVEGSLAIVGTDLETLSALSCLQEVTGTLHIGSVPFCVTGACFGFPNSRLSNLQGLERLRSVGTQLVIAMSPALGDVSALAGLESAGSLLVREAGALKDLSGLAGMKRLSDVQITKNPSLESLDGLGVVGAVGRMHISENASLKDIDALSGVTAIDGQLTISDNPLLTDVRGLRGVQRIEGGAAITGNPGLTSLAGLSSLTNIGGDLRVERCALEAFTGLESLERAGGVHVAEVPRLTSLRGLESLREIRGGALEIRNAPLLSELDALASLEGSVAHLRLVGPTAVSALGGLRGVTGVEGELQLSGHPDLSDVSGLSRLESASEVRIYGNPRLGDCQAESLAEGLVDRCADPMDPAEGTCTGLCICPGNGGTCPGTPLTE